MQNKNKSAIAPEPFVRRHRPLFVSLFVLIPLLIIPVLLIFTMLKNDRFQGWCTLHVVYENSQGLKKGHQISISGISIGHVTAVELIKEGVIHVSFNIGNRHKHLVREDTRARLKQRGFMGDWEIELIGGAEGFRAAREGDTLKADNVPASIDGLIERAITIIDTATLMMSYVTAIVRGIEAGEGAVGQIFKNDSVYRSVSRQVDIIGNHTIGITSNVRKITNDAQNTVRNVDTLLLTVTDVGKSGTALIDSLTTLLGTINTTIDKSVDDIGHILKNIKITSDDVPNLMERLQDELSEVEKMLRSLQDGWMFKAISGGEGPQNPNLTDTP